MTVAEFLTTVGTIVRNPPHNDVDLGERCLDYATIALQFEENERVAYRARLEEAARIARARRFARPIKKVA